MTDRHDPQPPSISPSGEAPGQDAQKPSRRGSTQRKPVRPRPRITIRSLTRVLLRHAEGPTPEKRLVVAVMVLAVADTRSTDKEIQQSALDFLQGSALDHWASSVGLDGDFVRELGRKAGYLPANEPATHVTTPSEEPGRNHAGL